MSDLDKEREDLDLYYSPSNWSKKRSPAEIVDFHIRTVENSTRIARESLVCRLNQEYEPGGQTVDIYYPKQGSADPPAAVFVFFHGGYWQQLGLEHAGFAAGPLTRKGIVLVSVGYDLAPKVAMTTIVEQCRKACLFVHREFPGKRVFVGGYSAGGHLAACMLSTNWSQYGLATFPFQGAVLLSGVYDLRPIKMSYVNRPLQLTEEEVTHFSPLEQAEAVKQLPSWLRCLVAEGAQESPAFHRQANEYCKVNLPTFAWFGRWSQFFLLCAK